MPLPEQPQRRRRLGERKRPGDRNDQFPRCCQRNDSPPCGISELSRLCSRDRDAIFIESSRERSDRNDAAPIRNEGKGHVKRFVRSDTIESGPDAARSEIADALVKSPAVPHRLSTESANQAEARLAARADDLRADQRGLLQDADTRGSGSSVHDDGICGAHSRSVKHLRCCRADEQQVGGFGERKDGRLREDVPGRYGDRLRVAALDAEGEHSIADRPASRGDLGIVANRREYACYLIPNRHGEHRRVVAPRPGDSSVVAGVHAGGAYADRDLTSPRGRYVYVNGLQHFWAAEHGSSYLHGHAQDTTALESALNRAPLHEASA